MDAHTKEKIQDQRDHVAAVRSSLDKIGRKYDRIHHTNWDSEAEVLLKLTMEELAALHLFGKANAP